MHHFKRLITAVFLTVLSIILIFSAGFAYLIVTPLGGKILLRYFKQGFSSVGLIHVGHYQGSLQNGFILNDVRITGLSYLPNALLRIQEVHIRLPLWDMPRSDFGIFNARILIPDSDPVVFTGDVYAGQIKGNLYATSVDIHEASRFWTSGDINKNLRGYLSNIDFVVQGPLSSPKLNGTFVADSIRYKSIEFSNGLTKIALILLPPARQCQFKGNMFINSGLIKVRNVQLQLLPSNVMFQGNFLDPLLDITLGAKVEDMDIHLAIKGTLANPQLTVSSDPPMAAQEALRVLFTGNAWSSSTSPFNGVTSGELAQNFLDYSLRDINEDQDIGFKTKLTDNLKLGAEMDQMPSAPGETNIYYSRKINGEMDLSDHMSLNVSKQFLPQEGYVYQGAQDSPTESDTQVYLQYKKRF